ncbi:hypothetical protein ABMA28_010657 [Loxostege sticticalis]|uniref:CCHC-type domain-containing protein n=1 Tax=Loxostege sticticalis TaxID=481309 RepID=A0ABD0S9R9_LOXSC
MKRADIRLKGFDDSVTEADVAAAIAAKCECPPEHVSVGKISANGDLRTVVVKVPLKAAKQLALSRRLLVGWSSAQVSLLASRPKRCLRCLGEGHECLRCGQVGHKIKECTAEKPKCSFCAAAGKPAGQSLGTKNCPQPAQLSRAEAKKLLAQEAAAGEAGLDVEMVTMADIKSGKVSITSSGVYQSLKRRGLVDRGVDAGASSSQ